MLALGHSESKWAMSKTRWRQHFPDATEIYLLLVDTIISGGLRASRVYTASMFENQYKLLARSENKVQEVMVQSSLDKQEMKSAVLKCTNKVKL